MRPDPDTLPGRLCHRLPLVLCLFLLALPVQAQTLALETCAAPDSGVSILLAELWEFSREEDPGYRVSEQQLRSAAAERDAVQREWLPTLDLNLAGDHGQRTSPGEERVLGVGPRAELRLVGQWTLLDSSRRWRAYEAESREAAARQGARLFDVEHRAALARLYIEASVSESAIEIHQRHQDLLDDLLESVRLRVAAGVDTSWEQLLLEEASARIARRRAQVEGVHAGLVAELSELVGRCVRAAVIPPAAIAPDPPPVAGEVRRAETSPEILKLRRDADAIEARARVEASRQRWRLDLIGIAGPTRSRAFDPGPVEEEYLVGLSASWSPDLRGLRSRLSEAELARGRSVEAEAESQRVAVTRELARIEAGLAHSGSERERLSKEFESAQRRLDAALRRWSEGMDRWTEVMQAVERLQDVESMQLDWLRTTTLDLIRLHEARGTLEAILVHFGQEGDDR